MHMPPLPSVELEASVAALQASLQDVKNEQARNRAEFERRLQALERGSPAKGEPTDALKAAEQPECNKPEEKPEDVPDAPPEYELGSTIWEATALIGLPQLGLGPSLLLTLVMLLNVFVQVFLCVVLLFSPNFTGMHKYKEKLEASTRWRLSVAHQVEQMDASGTSLASRVCNDDASLSVASSQTDLLGEINDYLSIDPADTENDGPGFALGAVLCGVCLFLFIVLVMRELRSTYTSLCAVTALTRGPTCVVNGTFLSMSPRRKAAFFAMALARALVAVALLITGVFWLSSTSSITDLILNAAALGFVMDLDELLLETMVPAKVITFVGTLQPVPYRKHRFHFEAVMPLVMTFALVVVCWLGLVRPNMQDMLNVKKALCAGDLDFVATKNPVGYVVSQISKPFKDEWEVGQDLTLNAVQELRDREAGSTEVFYSWPKLSEEDFRSSVAMTYAKLSEETFCQNMDAYEGGVATVETPAMYMAIRQTTGVKSGSTVRDEPWTCRDHKLHCDINGLLRSQCPKTCGCDDPLSGLFLLGPDYGCPTDCDREYLRAAQNMTCEDQDVAQAPGWTRYWNQYAEYIKSVVPERRETYRRFAQVQIAGGCANMQPDPLIHVNMCDAGDPFLAKNGLASMIAFCPRTCCSQPGRRPATCADFCK